MIDQKWHNETLPIPETDRPAQVLRRRAKTNIADYGVPASTNSKKPNRLAPIIRNLTANHLHQPHHSKLFSSPSSVGADRERRRRRLGAEIASENGLGMVA